MTDKKKEGGTRLETSLVLTRLGDDATANTVLTTLVNIHHAGMDRDAIREAIRQNPVTALAVIQRGVATGLTTRTAADALDEIVDLLPAAEARTLLADYMTDERLAELLTERRDLPSVATSVVSPKQLMDAVRLDVNASGTWSAELFTVRYWAMKLHDRDDIAEVLSQELLPGLTFRDAILLDILASVHGDLASVTVDQYVDVGLDELDSRERMNELAVRINTENENARLATVLLFEETTTEEVIDELSADDEQNDPPYIGEEPASIQIETDDAADSEPSTDDIAANLDI